MRLLLVEDDVHIAQSLRAILRPQFIVDVATSCDEARSLFELGEYALAILDVQLSDGTGWELCQTWRKQKISIPILFLTGATATSAVVHGLNLGADDYITKPFEIAELQARIQVLLRRSSLMRPHKLNQGKLLLDVSNYCASYDCRPLPLRHKEWQILDLLLRHPGHIITHATIWEHVWEHSAEVNPNTVEVHLSQLRRKLGKYCNKPLIETVRSVGYRFIKQD